MVILEETLCQAQGIKFFCNYRVVNCLNGVRCQKDRKTDRLRKFVWERAENKVCLNDKKLGRGSLVDIEAGRQAGRRTTEESSSAFGNAYAPYEEAQGKLDSKLQYHSFTLDKLLFHSVVDLLVVCYASCSPSTVFLRGFYMRYITRMKRKFYVITRLHM